MQRYKRYSRGYKNRAIVQKMFEILPIFDDGLQSQLFKSIEFFVSRTHLTCMLDTYPGRSGQVGRHRRPWRHTFFFWQIFFTRFLVKKRPSVLANFQWLKKWGLWPSKRKEYQGQQLWAAWAATAPLYRAFSLREGVTQMTPSLEEKKRSCHLTTINTRSLKGLDTICVLKNLDPLLNHQAIGIAAVRPLGPSDKSSMLSHFRSENLGFSSLLRNQFPVFLMNGSLDLLFMNFTLFLTCLSGDVT
jgi:hypothetical protein